MRLLFLSLLLLAGAGGWWATSGSPDVTGARARTERAPRERAPLMEGVEATTVEADLATLWELSEYVDRPRLESVVGRLLQRVQDAPDAPDAPDAERGDVHVALCEGLRLVGDVQGAVDHGLLATEAQPASSEAHRLHAKAVGELMRTGGVLAAMRQLGTYKALVAKAVELDPHNIEARVDRIGFLVFAPGMVGGDVDEALAMCDAMQEEDPRHAGLMASLALAQMDRLDDALERCAETLEAFPGDQTLHLTLARLYQESGRPEQAHPHFDAVLDGDLTAKYYQALYQRAVLRLEEGRLQEQVITDLEAYLEADPYGDFLPTIADVHARLGEVHVALGRTEVARASFQRALLLDEDHEDAEAGLDGLD